MLMTSAQRVWMTRRAYIGLQAELARLQVEARPELPDDARAERIRRIEHLLAHAVIDQDPPDDASPNRGGWCSPCAMTTPVRPRPSCWASAGGPKPPTSRCTRRTHRWAPRSSVRAPGEKRNFTKKDGRRLCVSLLAAEPYSSAVL